ncbi:unnamed protein product, partial [Hapterophycus canaliculatus]
PAKVRTALEAISAVGDVSVLKTTSIGSPEWMVTFLNNAGDLPLLTADSSAMWSSVTVAVDEERAGTSEAVSGSFDLGVSETDTERITVSYDASAIEVTKESSRIKNALESLSTTPGTLDVSRSEFFNGGSQWTVTFPAASGDVPSLYLNASGLSGTRILAAVSVDIAGSNLGGSFYLYSNSGLSEG